MAEKYSERVTRCDFCPSEAGRLETVHTRLCDEVISICKGCRNKGIVKKIQDGINVRR